MRTVPSLLLASTLLVTGLGLGGLGLGGCVGSSELGAERAKVDQPAGLALPLPTRTMMVIPSRDLDRPLIIQATVHRNEQVSMNDGRTLEKAGLSILGQIFQTVATNQPSIAPQLVIKLSGTPRYYRKDGLMKVGCVLDAYGADGTALGQYVSKFQTTSPVDYKDALEPAYAICLKQAADDMMAAPSVKRAIQTMGQPHPAAYKAFMESLGLKP